MKTLWNKNLVNATLVNKQAKGAGMSEAETVAQLVTKADNITKTEIFIDLTGLENGGAAGDIIGSNDASACWFVRIDPDVHGTITGAKLTCLEVPAGGDPDIDIYAADEATGTENAAITGLTETALVDAGDATLGSVDVFSAYPTAGQYLYLVAGAGATVFGSYTAGKLLVELYGTR